MRKHKRDADVVIVGGGASGLAAAIELGMKAPGLDVLVIEKNDEPARKLRATGSGRCNITNTAARGYIEIMKFFRRIGLVTRTLNSGLVYPYSESAADVAELLIARAKELGTEILTGASVTEIVREKADGESLFSITCSLKQQVKGKPVTCDIKAREVILACGGKAGPSYGTTGDGYSIARSLGHAIVTPVPALTAVECAEWTEGHRPQAIGLAGTRTRGKVTLLRDRNANDAEGTELFEELGEIQFTKTGLSGICVFNMTRFMRYDRKAGESIDDFVITADLFPDGDIRGFLRDRRSSAFPGETAATVLRSVLKENIAAYVLAAASEDAVEDDPEKYLSKEPLVELSDAEIDSIATSVHSLTFHPVTLRGWKDAQVTSGGVALDEIDDMTCESRLIPGLYITGELADRDFPCGGFNLSNAWLTGILAARAAAARAQAGR